MASVTDYRFHPLVVARTPFYPYRTYRDPLAGIMRDPRFAAAIFLSSKSLYQALAKKDLSYCGLTGKERLAVKQYFNRMCFRPTPFGLCAAVSATSWDPGSSQIRFSEKCRVKSLVSHEHAVRIAAQLMSRSAGFAPAYTLNTSLYRVNKAYRYIRYLEGGNGKRSFFIESVELSGAVADTLSYFRDDHPLNDLVCFLMREYGISRGEAGHFAGELIGRQLILPVWQPNITGREYLGRVVEKAGVSGALFTGMPNLSSVSSDGLDDFIQHLLPAARAVQELSGCKPGTVHPLYVSLERDCRRGLPPAMQEKIMQGLSCLEKIVPYDQNTDLETFKKTFKRKFGLRWIPLPVALDPEVGADPYAFGKQADRCDLAGDMPLKSARERATTIPWSPCHTFLLDQWNTSLGQDGGIPVITLTDDKLHAFARQNAAGDLPPGIAVLFRTVGTSVYIGEAGGASAVSLIGRFTAFNGEIRKAAAELSDKEQSANPDIIFAEIVHFSDFRAADIDRRAAVRQYEIPVLTGSAAEKSRRIALNDLWVSVVADEIILWSKRLQKRVIPRLSSAFNFLRSDLPVFRFLCDLQFQGIRSAFGLDLSALFPGLSFYPRVQYRDAVLHLASWHIDQGAVNRILARPGMDDRLAALQALARELKWPERISLNRQDTYIVIDTSREEEWLFLLKLCRKNESLIIREFPFAEDDGRTDRSAGAGGYIAQYAALLYRDDRVYRKVAPPAEPGFQVQQVKRNFLPGSAWNYFKIYCHPARSNEILTRHIAPLCERWLDATFADQWFFVRYADPGYHLRVRIHGDPVNAGLFTKGLNHIMTPLVDAGLAGGFEAGVYEREIERYGEDIIECAEKTFFAGSRLVAGFLNYFSEDPNDNALFEMAYSSIGLLMDSFQYSLEDRISLFEQYYKRMAPEFAVSEQEPGRLKRKFRALREANSFLPGNRVFAKYKLQTKAAYFRDAHETLYRLVKGASAPRKAALAGDIIHMHLNRLCAAPRRNELVVYYCLWRHYVSKAGRQRAASRLFVDQQGVD